MNVHRALAALALSLRHCGYDHGSTLPALEPVAGEIAARPRDEAPRAWESGTSCSALKLCTRVSRKMLLFCGASLSWSAMKWLPPSTA